MKSSNAYHIRERIREFKRDADCYSYCARQAQLRKLPNAFRVAGVNRAVAAKMAEWGFAYDQMLRGEYAEI